MNKLLFTFLFLLLSLFYIITPLHAQTPPPPKTEFYKAKVIKILEEGRKKIGKNENIFQIVELQILEGPEKNTLLKLEHGGTFILTVEQKIAPDDTVVLNKTIISGKPQYRIADTYRLINLFYVLVGFFVLVIVMAGRKGLGSFLGMGISIAVIVYFIIPQILNGANPLTISLLGAIFIMLSTIYLAHGFSRQTSIAVASTCISLVFAILLSILLVKITRLSGLGSEDIYNLTQGFAGKIQFQGLLLGGIIIGTLGVLDDVTTTQTATVFNLADANPKFSVKDLFFRGMNIGREHIASLVNTLVLAYAGASMGVFIYMNLAIKQQNQPLWVILNSEVIMEEIIRSIAGSVSLIIAVPITTILAAFFTKYSLKMR